MAFEWTDDRVQVLRDMWGQGCTAREIAERLGPGVSRNAVIGKANRLGLSQPTKSSVSRKARRRAPVQKRPDPMPEEPVIGDGATILTLTKSSCRWPIGHPGEEGFKFCGAGTEDNQPYCPYHARMAYQPLSKDNRRRERNSQARRFG